MKADKANPSLSEGPMPRRGGVDYVGPSILQVRVVTWFEGTLGINRREGMDYMGRETAPSVQVAPANPVREDSFDGQSVSRGTNERICLC